MNNQQLLTHETLKVIRLLDYLLRLASLRTKLTRDIAEYENVLWLSNVPHERGCFTQAWGRDEKHETDEWLEVQNRREPELPLGNAQFNDWVNESAIRNKNGLPDLLPKITRQLDQDPSNRQQTHRDPRCIGARNTLPLAKMPEGLC